MAGALGRHRDGPARRARAPQLFHTDVGIAQITRQREPEKLAYRSMLERSAAEGNAKRLTALRRFPILDEESLVLPFYRSVPRDDAMHELGIGTMRTMTSVLRHIVLPVLLCRACTVREKIGTWVSKLSFVRQSGLIDEQFARDFPAEVPGLELPVYFLSGALDLTVHRDLARVCLAHLAAPLKDFHTFADSAHSPLFEEPERTTRILVHDVLAGRTEMADAAEKREPTSSEVPTTRPDRSRYQSRRTRGIGSPRLSRIPSRATVHSAPSKRSSSTAMVTTN